MNSEPVADGLQVAGISRRYSNFDNSDNGFSVFSNIVKAMLPEEEEIVTKIMEQ